MEIAQPAMAILLTAALSGCIVTPKVDVASGEDATCNTVTKHMALKAIYMRQTGCAGSSVEGIALCFAAYAAIGAGSTLVSGSIVLTNNTLHWLEYQGRCSESNLKIEKQKLLESLDKPEHTGEGSTASL